jgi:hypothetical protein
VSEARRLAALPRRPAWRDSDPRWRRRMLAGVWILVLLPLIGALLAFEPTSNLRVPNVFGFPGAITLGESLASNRGVYDALMFCMGVVLLFSKERARPRSRLDWTPRWGVACSYMVLLLNAVQIFYIATLVMAGIAALFMSMPPKYQPVLTRPFVEISQMYIRYGPCPKNSSFAALVAFSSTAILLACVPLFNALASCGRKWVAVILLAPLALFALVDLALAGWYGLIDRSPSWQGLLLAGDYFRPGLLFWYLNNNRTLTAAGSGLSDFLIEATKWCAILAIALRLTFAQLAARRHRKRATGASSVLAVI